MNAISRTRSGPFVKSACRCMGNPSQFSRLTRHPRRDWSVDSLVRSTRGLYPLGEAPVTSFIFGGSLQKSSCSKLNKTHSRGFSRWLQSTYPFALTGHWR
jgi:hypothetical protein